METPSVIKGFQVASGGRYMVSSAPRRAPGVRLSVLLRLDPMVAISVPLAGGLVFGVARELIAS